VTGAPLLSIAEAPAPNGTTEFYRGADGASLRAALFPAAEPRGTVILSPGRTEPIEKYHEVATDLLTRGFSVLAHDWRGQGGSDRPLPDRLKGHADGFDAYVSDYALLLDAFVDRAPRPWIAVGHSLGGCLILLAMAEGERRIDAAALSAPMLRLQTGGRPYRDARVMAWIMARSGRGTNYVLGDANSPYTHTFEANALTRDRARYERWRAQLAAAPELGLGGVTWGWLDAAFRATARLQFRPGLERVTAPVVIVAAGEDHVVDNAGSRAAAERLPNGRYVEVAGALHEILIETDDKRAQWFAAFDQLAAASRSRAPERHQRLRPGIGDRPQRRTDRRCGRSARHASW
jgi:lysophospholipase